MEIKLTVRAEAIAVLKLFAADKDVRYEAVLEVMDMLQQNQVQKVGLLARPRN